MIDTHSFAVGFSLKHVWKLPPNRLVRCLNAISIHPGRSLLWEKAKFGEYLSGAQLH